MNSAAKHLLSHQYLACHAAPSIWQSAAELVVRQIQVLYL